MVLVRDCAAYMLRVTAMLLMLATTAWAQTVSSVAGDSDEADTLWALLNTPNHAALMRHALAPGTGDPANFEVSDCSTQRNLSDTGRQQSKAIGTLFRDKGISSAAVFSSQWCRCQDTATLMALGPVTPLPIINSFFRDRQNAAPQTQALAKWLVTEKPTAPTVLVTHQVNITALTGVYPASGDIVIIKLPDDAKTDPADAITVVGRMSFQP